MTFFAVRNLFLAIALSALSPGDELPLDEWNQRIEQLESLELVYQFEDREGELVDFAIRFEAPNDFYIRTGDSYYAWLEDGKMYMRVRPDDTWETTVLNVSGVVVEAAEWIDELAERLPHNHQFSTQEARASLSFWPGNSEQRGLRMDLQLTAADVSKFAWMNERALDGFTVEQGTDGFEVKDDEGLRVLLDSEFGVPIAAWRESEGEEREVLTLQKIAVDEGVEIPEPPEDAEDRSIEFARGVWVHNRALAYRCLWTRAHHEDIALEDSERESVVDSFRDFHSKADAVFFAERLDFFRERIDANVTKLQETYDEVREREGATDELDQFVNEKQEPALRRALTEFRDQYHARFAAPEVAGADEDDLEEFFELELEGARQAYDEEVLEPLVDYLLEELEHVG